MKVLIVDDRETDRCMMALELRDHFDVVEAAGYDQAVSALEDHDFAVVVSDLDLGRYDGVSGVTVLEAVKLHQPHCLRVLVSGADDDGWMQTPVAHMTMQKGRLGLLLRAVRDLLHPIPATTHGGLGTSPQVA